MTRLLWTAALALLVAGRAAGQPINKDDGRAAPKVLAAFRDVVAGPSASAVRVESDGKAVALGTVVAADGWIVTKASELGETVTVKLKDGKELPAKVVGVHDPYDLALLRVEATDLAPVTWRDGTGVKVGQWVATVGPQADAVAVGVVSVGRRKYRVGDQPPKNPGANAGYLGVGLDEGEGGAKVAQVMPGSPAQKAGLKVNDIVVEADGRRIVDNETLINAVQGHRPGDDITLKIQRGDEKLDVTATLGRLPKGFVRENPQEKIGGALSNRRGGFPTILQHDTVLKPADAGGPLVDLDGKAVGVNIARAGRTETYAVPAEDVVALLPDLKSGKLAPKEAPKKLTAAPPKKAAKDDPAVVLSEAGTLGETDPPDPKQPGRRAKVYKVELTAGVEYTIDLESDAFDPFLRLEDAKGKNVAENDDRAPQELDARIVYRAPRDGTYRVVVTSFEPGETGAFTLTVRKGEKE